MQREFCYRQTRYFSKKLASCYGLRATAATMNPPRADCAPPRADCAPLRADCDPPDCEPPDCDHCEKNNLLEAV